MLRELDGVARSAVGIDGIQSAAVFRVIRGGADPGLVLVGAAGIDGPPLDGLIAAVANPPTRFGEPSRTPDRRSTWLR
jgi:hypothetical protein